MRDRQDRINRTTFDDLDVLSSYSSGWTDLGERRMMRHVAALVAGRPVLDLGVGGGRTTALLRKHVSTDYVGLDYAPNSVTMCRREHPDADVRLGDARDLSLFESGSFGLVCFSLNGLDSVDHHDRREALRGMARVVADDGRVWYSTLNLHSIYADARPWNLDARGLPLQWHPHRLWAWLRVGPRQLPRYLRSYRNWLRVHRYSVEGEGWAVRPLQAESFGLLAHFTSLDEVFRELADVGLEPERVIGSSGDELELADASTTDPYVHVCARKIPGPTG
jgi:SAM-dependent methyltransferase